ncbi:MAG: YwaF family protein [Clostridia bacterium]|nr:YwaF family protein [Clostridia bacterium]
MENFFYIIENVPDGIGFRHFDSFHITWLIISLICVVIGCSVYCRLGSRGRDTMRKALAALIILDEVFKMWLLWTIGTYPIDYLPLHLCSINIFVIVYHAWKRSDFWGQFLFYLCVPGAIAALLFCTWTPLPPQAGMLLHSFTIHIMLILYPLMMVVGGDLVPDLRSLPKVTLALVGFAVPATYFNVKYGTNFLFIGHAQNGTPFMLFEEYCGSYLVGVPFLLALMYFLVHLVWLGIKKFVLKKDTADIA